MISHRKRGLASAYVLAVTAVLGLGVKEVTAAPAVQKASAAACTLADHRACADWCDSMGWSYDYAVCTEYGCECRIRMCGDTFC